MNQAAALPDHVLELVAMLNTSYGTLSAALFDLAEQYGTWARKNLADHLRLEPELMDSKLDPLQSYKYEAVDYLLVDRAPTCADIARRYDTWFFEVTTHHDAAFFRAFAQHRVLVEKIFTLERMAAAKTDPKACAEAYRAAASLLALLLKIKEPTL